MNPTTETHAAELIVEARANKTPLHIHGGGTRSSIGRPLGELPVLSTKALSGITLFEPSELVIAAKPGTGMAEVNAAIASANLIFPFEPADYRALLGTTGEPTMGGLAATNMSGPRRINAGSVRDQLLGIRLINGRGETVKSGGRVMKNVTGLDLVKINCGAYGTLGLLTEVTFKLQPRPEQRATLVLQGLTDAKAVEALSIALGSPFEILGAAHLPAGVDGAQAKTLLRIEGFADSVKYRLEQLQNLLRTFGAADALDDATSIALWAKIRDVSYFARDQNRAIWRVSTAPDKGHLLLAQLKQTGDVQGFYDWGGGLLWLSVPDSGDASAANIRAALKPLGGHATLFRASENTRKNVAVFQPLSEPLMKLTASIKASFDPDAILNPGRMYAGI